MSGIINRAVTSLRSWEGILGSLTILLLIVASLTTPGFATAFNITNSLSEMSERMLMVLPLALIIIVRDIDISVASIAGLTGILAGIALENGAPLWVAIVTALVTGMLCGMVNGFFVAALGLPAMIVTLGTLALFRGLCYVLVGGQPVTAIPPELISFGNSSLFGFIPYDIIPFLILAPIVALVLHNMASGRRIYAIGGNPDTARYSGVRTVKIKMILSVFAGFVCAIAGIINVGRTAQASPDGCLGFELDAITVVFLGGVDPWGGKGKMSGVYWALILIVSLRSFLQLNNTSGYAQGVAVGLLLIVSLLITNIVRGMRAKTAAAREAQKLLAEIHDKSTQPA